MTLFEKKHILPMLIAENKPPFNSEEYIYELKFDGLRAIAFLDENRTDLRNKRNKNLNSVFPELSSIHQLAKDQCIIDGEIIIMKDGKPSFSELQSRSLMTNQFKIALASQKLPASFIAFDILYLDGERITSLSLLERKKIMEQIITNGTRLIKSNYIEYRGVEFFNIAKDQGLEGIVAKRKESKYYFGKRTKEWIKCKALLAEDFIVCGYYFKGADYISVIIGSFNDSQIIYRGHVVIGVSKQDYILMCEAKKCRKDNFYSLFPDFIGAEWLQPKLVCIVEFMEYTKNGSLRQPIYRGLRDDKTPEECIAHK